MALRAGLHLAPEASSPSPVAEARPLESTAFRCGWADVKSCTM